MKHRGLQGAPVRCSDDACFVRFVTLVTFTVIRDSGKNYSVQFLLCLATLDAERFTGDGKPCAPYLVTRTILGSTPGWSRG